MERRQSVQWSAAQKARWLAELARAVDEAQQVIFQMAAQGGSVVRAGDLYGRLEAARDEIERLQRDTAREVRVALNTDWSELAEIVARN